MAYEESLRSISLNADDTLAVKTGVPGQTVLPDEVTSYGNLYRFVKVTGKNQVGLCTDPDDAVGVLNSKPQVEGQESTIGFAGVTNVISGGAIDAGDNVISDADGRGISGAGRGGIALTDCAAEGQLVSVLLQLGS